MRTLAPLTRLKAVLGGSTLAGVLLLAPPATSQVAANVEALRGRATQGDPEAQNSLGNFFTNGGGGVSPDFAEALRWFQQAAGRGFAPAQFNLGLAYELGRGVPVDERQAFKYYLMAAEQGYAPAQFNVANMYTQGRGIGQDYFEANLWYKQAADAGLPDAQFNLALAYELGRGVRKDEGQAARWYRLAAEKGFAAAQYNLGLLTEDGRGVAKDPAAALALYRAAAEQGFAAAQANYGLMLAESRAGTPSDPVQGYVWLARAAQQGAGIEARDQLRARLSPTQLAAASRLLGEETRGPSAVPPAPTSASGEPSLLVDQLREQSRRLAGQVETLTADKEAAERQVAILTAQVRDGAQELARARSGSPIDAATAPAANAARLEERINQLTGQLERSTTALKEAQATNAQLAEANQRLQQEKLAPAASVTDEAAKGDAPDPAVQAAMLANLRRDNARLNDEVKRSTRELLSLNSQLRSLRATPPPAGGESSGGAPAQAGEVEQLTARAERAAADVARLEGENRRLAARVTELEGSVTASQAATAATGRLEQDNRELRERLAQENRDLAARLTRADEALKAAQARQQQLADEAAQAVKARDEAQGRMATGATDHAALRATLQNARTEIADLKADLAEARQTAARNPSTENLRDQLAELNRALEKSGDSVARLHETNRRLTGELAALGGLREENARLREAARAGASGTGEVERLQTELAGANQGMERLQATIAELTAANERLGQDLAASRRTGADTSAQRDELARARRDLAEMATLRDENIRLRSQVAAGDEFKARNEQLARDNEQLTAFMNGNRADLDKAQARVAELEKQAADALTVRTSGGDAARRLEAELAEANRTVEKLNATVAELTEANDKLEKDTENAQKAAAAALAAQTQALNAASPEAFRMEISTLASRIKQLEEQVEEERANAAREVTALASQLQRTRETNKSLTDANRALLSAKESDLSANREELAQAQARVRELTSGNEELRRAGQQQAATLRTLTTERDELKGQLTDARQVATMLPGMADEKAALQERLEAVGAQLLQLQREQEAARQAGASSAQQLAASRQATEKAQADLAAQEARVREAERAAEAHNLSVAELTQANTKLEQEHEDMRRLVDSYRADIARLNQNVRAADQLRVSAERSGQQNIDAVAAQLAQVRRELEAARANQTRLADNFTQQERERNATIAQLRTENSALTSRLTQAQGTLDQIAAAARLGTPAATIASGAPAPSRPPATVSPTGEARVHTVTDGDSLSRISMRYYGTANRWQEIFQANRDVLQGSNSLRVGQQLRIP